MTSQLASVIYSRLLNLFCLGLPTEAYYSVEEVHDVSFQEAIDQLMVI